MNIRTHRIEFFNNRIEFLDGILNLINLDKLVNVIFLGKTADIQKNIHINNYYTKEQIQEFKSEYYIISSNTTNTKPFTLKEEKIKVSKNKWYENNKDKTKQWYQEHKEELKENRKERYKTTGK